MNFEMKINYISLRYESYRYYDGKTLNHYAYNKYSYLRETIFVRVSFYRQPDMTIIFVTVQNY